MSTFSDILTRLESEHRLRRIPEPLSHDLIDLSSNDYLGLASRYPEFLDEFRRLFPDAAFSSSASRLLSTRQEYHLRLEDLLSSLYTGATADGTGSSRKEALLFNSGYHANVGCIGALTLPSTLFICDKLIHASVIDGLRINQAVFKRFPHNDIAALKRIVEKECRNYSHIVVVVESIYSMDGDEAPLRDLVALRRQHPEMLLYVDEAHAFGVRGERGLGLCEELGLIADTDILIGTFGKAAASVGAFAIVSEELKSLFINTARPFIFSTALPPVNTAWSLLMTEKITDMAAERRQIASLSTYFSELLSTLKEDTGMTRPSTLTPKPSSLNPHASTQIIPFLTGDASRALEIASGLRDAGVLALPIRRPTVPPGGERIRFSLSAALTEQQLRYTADTLRHILKKSPFSSIS